MGKYSSKRGGGPNVPVLLGFGALVLALFGGAYLWLTGVAETNKTSESTGCLVNRPTPEAMLVLVDQTDKLSRDNAERIRTHIRDRVNELPRFSRLIIVPFGGDLANPLEPIFDQCVPGKSEDGGLTEGSLILQQKYEEFTEALDTLVDALQEIPDSETSPITAQVERAASDSVLHWEGEVRRLYIVTDGLESTIYWTKELHLKEPTDNILRDVKAEYFEIGNSRNGRLQTRELREEWKSWLEKAGAEVRMDAPGYPS